MFLRSETWALCVLGAAFVAGCSTAGDPSSAGAPIAGSQPRDLGPDGLYQDFLDGKYDGAGHPLSAQVWEAESDCTPATGAPELEGLGVHSWEHAPGTLCAPLSESIGSGRFYVNVRALVADSANEAIPTGCACDEEASVFVVRVLGPEGQELVSREVLRSEFEQRSVYQNLRVPFTHSQEGPVRVEVSWSGQVTARVDYLELFRARRALHVNPPSGVLDASPQFEVELLDPTQYAKLRFSCNGEDRTEALNAMLDDGSATRMDTEYRTIYRIPANPMLEGCALPARLMAQMVEGPSTQATSRVTIYDREPPCVFVDGATRVLLTGFEPFPADSTRDNSSEHAVTHFDASQLAGVSVMSLVLPVEFDTAAEILARTIKRCEPDVVIGFGQGRSAVDLETTAYNRKDSAAFSGGIPDNRGFVAEGIEIVDGAPAELASGLPLPLIRDRLVQDGIDVGLSDDPGRYVCNNLFYRMVHTVQGSGRVAGFVHLPRIPIVDEASASMLQTVVSRVVEAGVEEHRTAPLP